MTGLTEADIQRVIDGFMWTRKVDARGALCHKDQDAEQETRILAALRDETDTRMLLDVARQDGAADKARLDWLEDASKVYSITVQSQPHGTYVVDCFSPEIRAAIDSARGR